MAGTRIAVSVALFLALLADPATGSPFRNRHIKHAPPCPWGGIYPTVLTPFCDGGVDVASLEKQLRFELSGGVHGLLLLGTLGEGQYTSPEERAQVITTSVHVVCGAIPIVVGIHTCDVQEALAQLTQAKELGASAALVKFVGKPNASAQEVLGFYATLADAHLLPILYYHYPSQTHLKLSPDDIANILHLGGVIGIKESTLNLREVQEHMGLTKGEGKVYLSGTALNLTQFMALGGNGAMCPEAVLLPGPTVQAFCAVTAGQMGEARAIQSQLFAITPILRSGSSSPTVSRIVLMSAEDHQMPVPMGHDQPQAKLKAALNCMGVPTPTLVKCPLPQLTQHDLRRVQSAVTHIKSIDWSECALEDVPPVPLHRCCYDSDLWGGLLRTGSFQLGPQVGKDLLRSQGDGQSGF